MKKTWKLAAIAIFSLLNAACGGSESTPSTPVTTPDNTQFNLAITLSGLSDSGVSFRWLGQSYSISTSQTVSVTAVSYSAPTELTFADTHQCTSTLSKANDTDYNWLISCEKKAVEQAFSILIDSPLPYAVDIKLNDDIFTIKEQSLATEIITSDTPTIVQTDGPLLCNLNPDSAQSAHWRLKCDEFLIATEPVANSTHTDVVLTTPTEKIQLTITGPAEGQNITLIHQAGSQYFLLGSTIYSLQVGQNASIDLTALTGQFVSLTQHQQALYGLANDGLYRYSETLNTWQQLRPITRPLASALFVSGETLSWLTQMNDALLLDRWVNNANKSTTTADQQISQASDHGALSIDNGVMWLAKNQQNQWLLTAVELMANTVNQVIQTLDQYKQFALWQTDATTNQLLMIEGGSLATFTIENQSMSWQPYQATSADLVGAHKQLLVTATTLSQSQAQIHTLYHGKTELNHTALNNTFNWSSPAIIALQTDSTAFSSISIKHGLLLFYIEEQSEVWISDGTLNNTKRLLSDKSWQEFTNLKIIAAGQSVLLLNNKSNNQLMAITR